MLSKRLDDCRVCGGDADDDVSDAGSRAGPRLDSRTEFTFNQPVELPGVTLPPGTYIFRFVDATTRSQSDAGSGEGCQQQELRHVHDDLASARRPSDDAELRFLETPAGQPAAVKTWWYPGNTIGREFIYPKVAGPSACASDELRRC